MFNLFSKKPNQISISPSIAVFTVCFLLSLVFFYIIHEILAIFFLSFIVMVALNPAVDKLEKKVKSRGLSALIVYLLVGSVISSLLALLVPPLAKQLLQLVKYINLPYLQDEVSNLKFTAQELNQLANNYSAPLSTILSLVNTTFKSLFNFLTMLVISFYLMLDEPKLHLKLYWFTRNKKHIKIARKFLNSIEDQLGGWFRGQLILMILIAIITYLGLAIIGIPFALPLALLAGMLEILPNLGPTLAAVPALTIAYLNTGRIETIAVLAFYFLLQQIENNLIVPKIMKENADVNPLIGMLSILIGFKIYGVIGGLLAIPIYILGRTMYSFWRQYKKHLAPNW